MKEVIMPGIVLFIITLIVATLLGTVNAVTEETIRENALANKRASMAKVLPDAVDNNFSEDYNITDDINITQYNIGYNGEKIVGYVISCNGKGFSGVIKMLVGIDIEGKVAGVDILSHNETPGLGANANSDKYLSQYNGKSGVIGYSKTKAGPNEVDAISGSTITTKAVTDIINSTINYYNTHLKDREAEAGQ